MLIDQVCQNKMERGLMLVRIPVIRVVRFLELKISLGELIGAKGHIVREGQPVLFSQYY